MLHHFLTETGTQLFPEHWRSRLGLCCRDSRSHILCILVGRVLALASLILTEHFNQSCKAEGANLYLSLSSGSILCDGSVCSSGLSEYSWALILHTGFQALDCMWLAVFQPSCLLGKYEDLGFLCEPLLSLDTVLEFLHCLC